MDNLNNEITQNNNLPEKKAVKPKVVLLIVSLIILELCSLILAATYGYRQGLRSEVGKNPASDTTQINMKADLIKPTSVPGLVYPLSTKPEDTTYDYSENLKINLSSIEELKTGYPSSKENLGYEVFLFADLTEDSFSGQMLTQNVNFLFKNYPQMRVWYLHTVLPYRENPNLKGAIGVLKCLNDQDSVWKNMDDLVKEKGRHNYIYQLENQETYTRCITEINQNDQYFQEKIINSQELMAKYGISGIPSIIVVSENNPSIGNRIIGALPRDEFVQRIEEIIREN